MMLQDNILSLTDSLTIYRSMAGIDQEMQDMIWDMGGDDGWWSLIDTAYALAVILALIMVAKMAYRMMALQGEFDVLQLLRPIMVALVLANWYFVVRPLTAVASSPESLFRYGYERNAYVADSLRKVRNHKQDSLGLYCMTLSSTSEGLVALEQALLEEKAGDDEKVAGTSAELTVNEMLSSEATDMYEDPDAGGRMVETYMSGLKVARFIESVALWIGEFFWEMAVFFIFIIKNAMLLVLVWFGPVIVACTLLEAWKDEWLSWVGKVVNVCLYGACAYLVMSVTMRVVVFALEKEIASVDAVMGGQEELFAYIKYIGNGGMPISMTVLALFAGTAALLGVPAMASLLFPASAMAAASGMLTGVWDSANKKIGQAAGVAWKAVKAAATGGAGLVGEAVKAGIPDRTKEGIAGGQEAGQDRIREYWDHRDNTEGLFIREKEEKKQDGGKKKAVRTEEDARFREADRKLDDLLDGNVGQQGQDRQAQEMRRYEEAGKQLDELLEKTDSTLGTGGEKASHDGMAMKAKEARSLLFSVGIDASLQESLSLKDKASITEKDGMIRISLPYRQAIADALDKAGMAFSIAGERIVLSMASRNGTPEARELGKKEIRKIETANGRYEPELLGRMLLPTREEWLRGADNYTREMALKAARQIAVIAATSAVLSPIGAVLVLWASDRTCNVLRSVDAFNMKKPSKAQMAMLRMGRTVYVRGGLLGGDRFLYMHKGKVYSIDCRDVQLPDRIAGIYLNSMQLEILRRGELLNLKGADGKCVAARVDLSCPQNVRVYAMDGKDTVETDTLDRYRKAGEELDRLLQEKYGDSTSGNIGQPGTAEGTKLKPLQEKADASRTKLMADISMMSMEALEKDPAKEIRLAARAGYWNKEQAMLVQRYVTDRAALESAGHNKAEAQKWQDAVNMMASMIEKGKYKSK